MPTELWLEYKDENDENRRIPVRAEKFFIGRSPENNLCIQRSELSRLHAEINRFEDVFVISDCGSSNGTSVNGEQLRDFPVSLKDGDLVILGGGVQLKIGLTDSNSNKPDFAGEQPFESASGEDLQNNAGENIQGNEVSEAGESGVAEASIPTAAAAANISTPQTAESSGSFLKSFFIIAPVLAVFTLIFGCGLLWFFGGRKEKPAPPSGDDYVYSPKKESENKRRTDDGDDEKKPTPTPKDTPKSGETPASSDTLQSPSSSSTPSKSSSELDTVERSALPFMRRIAVRDETYYFEQKQLTEINNQIKSYKGSSSLRDNLKAVKKDASKFEELAKTKGLKPQFLAAAALAKSGNQNPLTTAQTMLPILGELRITLNNELSDDNLLIIAAYDLGERGKFRAMQSTLEALSKQTTGVAANKIRTIWFLRERGKISDSQYAFALRFLAIGAIMQNPKEFGIDADPVIF